MSTDSSSENLWPTNNNIDVISSGPMNSNIALYTPNLSNFGLFANNVHRGVLFSTPSSIGQSCHWNSNDVQIPKSMESQNIQLPSPGASNNQFTNSINLQFGTEQPRFRYSPGISLHWSSDEQYLLGRLLREHVNERKPRLYGLIAQKLKNKTIRDVALRLQWMKMKGLPQQQVEQHGYTTSRKRARENSSKKSTSPAMNHPRSFPLAMIASHLDNNEGNLLKDKVSQSMELLSQSVEGLEKVSADLVDLQVGENVNLLRTARLNILTAMEKAPIEDDHSSTGNKSCCFR